MVCACDVFEIYDNDILISIVINAHYKCMGYVVPKPNCSSNEGINSRCRRFDLLCFRRFNSDLSPF